MNRKLTITAAGLSAGLLKNSHVLNNQLSSRNRAWPARQSPSARQIKVISLEPLGLSVTAGAKVLGVTRQTLTKVVNGKSGISPEMAIRLTKAFGSTEETWLRMQLAYDLAEARKQASKIKVNGQYVPEEAHI